MKKISVKQLLVYLSIIFGGIILDQLTKYLALVYVQPVKSIPIIKGIFHLTYTENPGMAFGLLSEARWLFISVSTIAIGALAAFLFLGKSPNALYSSSIAIIISGGVGNMIDRFGFGFALQSGRVVDMFEFAFIDFAIFNFADSLVCVGAGLLILALLLDIKEEVKKARKSK